MFRVWCTRKSTRGPVIACARPPPSAAPEPASSSSESCRSAGQPMDDAMAAEERRRRLVKKRRRAQPTSAALGASAAGSTPPNFSRLGALEVDAAGRLPAALRSARLAETTQAPTQGAPDTKGGTHVTTLDSLPRYQCTMVIQYIVCERVC